MVLKRCTQLLEDGESRRPMTDAQRAGDPGRQQGHGGQGAAGAGRRLAGTTPRCPPLWSPDDLEQDLTFLGLAGMIDPVRPGGKGRRGRVPAGGHPPGHDHRRPQGHRRGHRQGAGHHLADASQALTGAELDAISDEEFWQRDRQLSASTPGYSRSIRSASSTPGKARGCRHRHDRRRRQRRPLHQIRGHRRGHGHHRHRRDQERGGYGSGRRQLRHHRRRRWRRAAAFTTTSARPSSSCWPPI